MELKFAGLESLFEDELAAVVNDISISEAPGIPAGKASAPLCAQSFAETHEESVVPAGVSEDVDPDTTTIEAYMTPKHMFINQIKAYM